MTLCDVIELVRGTTYKGALLGEPGPYLLGLASIAKDGGFRDDNLKTYGGESPEKLLLYPGDIYVSLKDVTQSALLLGAVARVPETVRVGRLTQDTLKLVFKSGSVPVEYVYWLLRTPQYRAYCKAHATGTTTLGLSRDDFLDFELPDYDRKRQSLVELLESIEKKIELNRQSARTLEELAQRLFKSWFVDFDPVHAKTAGRQPAHTPAGIAELFPDRLVDSTLGPIPEGWDVVELKDLLEINPRESLKKNTDALYVEMSALPTSGMSIEGAYIRPFKSGTKFRRGDTLMARITPCLENGKGALFLHDHGDLPAWGSTEFIVLRPQGMVPELWPYLLMRDVGFREFAIQNMTGTSGRQRVSAKTIGAFTVSRPPNSLLHAFGQMLDVFSQRIEQLRQESETLGQLRDRLLPKLISGQIRVPDAREMAEESVS